MKHRTATLRVLGPAPHEEHGHLLIASADPAWLRHLRPVLQPCSAHSVDEVGDRVALEKALTQDVPDVLLVDLSTGTFSLDTLWIIRTLSPTTRTVFLTNLPDDNEALTALREGAAGYGSRQTEAGLLVAAIGLVRRGGIWVAPRVILQLIERLGAPHGSGRGHNGSGFLGLTPREHQIAELIASGAANKEIADRLHIEERTVKAHVSNIFPKVGVSNRVQLASYVWTRPKVQ